LGYEDDYDMNENLTENIEFIYGPPGTGKTTLLVKQVSKILTQSKSKTNILILTPTNKAADVIAEKMVGDEECFKYLTRFGATESLYLIEEAGVVGNRETTNLSKSNKNIVVTTTARYAYDCIQPDDTFLCDFNWDYIIIDEASMVDIVTCTYILYKGCPSKFIISGDPKQIQPVAQNDMPPYNIYDMVSLSEFSNAVNDYDRYKVITLTTQYRSIPEIGNLVSEYTYNGLVHSDPNRTPQKPLSIDGLNIKNINFVGFEVQDFDLIKGLSEIDGSAFHLYSAIFTYKFAEHIIKQITSKYPVKDYSLGIVSPYRAQANSIKQMLENRPIHTDNCSVTCGTAHSFQGDECDIMLIVLNPPLQCSNKSHINNQNIINVAMSRARDYIFFIMPQGQPKGMKIKEHLNYILDKKQKGMFFCPDVENIMFGSTNFIVSNTHVTCHMPVNVYCEENSLYEVRLSNEAIDIKINE
jgi:superfamily I DNA and/or RNA helicase